MRTVLVPVALTLFAATVVVIGFFPDDPTRTPIDVNRLALTPATLTDAESLLADAFHANGHMAFEGTLTVVGVEGPHVFQIEVDAEVDGTREVHSGAWLFGRDGTDAWASSNGRLLEAGAAAAPAADFGLLAAKYDANVAGVRDLPTGKAHVVVLTERDTGVEREWLSVDDRTNLIVRRETFDDTGVAVRLVAFETLRSSGEMNDDEARPQAEAMAALPETWQGITIRELPGRFVLQDMTEHGGEAATMALLYSDGLYHLSIYPQEGGLDEGQLHGGVRETHGDMNLYRWPGAEPQRLVWSGGGHTYTAITDAPLDAVLPAISQFPGDPEDGTLTRMRRGLERVADTLWPFD